MRPSTEPPESFDYSIAREGERQVTAQELRNGLHVGDRIVGPKNSEVEITNVLPGSEDGRYSEEVEYRGTVAGLSGPISKGSSEYFKKVFLDNKDDIYFRRQENE